MPQENLTGAEPEAVAPPSDIIDQLLPDQSDTKAIQEQIKSRKAAKTEVEKPEPPTTHRGRPAKVRTLSEIVANQAERPNIPSVMSLASFVRQREATGQPRDQAIQEVMLNYGVLVSRMLSSIGNSYTQNKAWLWARESGLIDAKTATKHIDETA